MDEFEFDAQSDNPISDISDKLDETKVEIDLVNRYLKEICGLLFFLIFLGVIALWHFW